MFDHEQAAPRWGVWFSSALSTLLPSHCHACPELNLLMSGTLQYRVAGLARELTAQAGQLVVLPPGVDHELVRTSHDVALWVVEQNGMELPLGPGPARVVTPGAAWRKAFVADVRRLWLRPSLTETLQLQDRLKLVQKTLRHRPGPPEPQDLHPAVVRAKELCERSLGSELDAAQLARESGLSASRLAHLFADQVGISPLQYRNFAQVQRFIRAYNGEERNLLRAALAAGFGSYAQFHRVFRQVCGERPAAHFKWLAASDEVDPLRTLGDRVPSHPDGPLAVSVTDSLR